MKYIYSQLPKKQYLEAMKRKFDNPFCIFDKRITGIVLGPFFAAAHYQSYEWNRKITSECNRAYGFVKEVDGELEICFLRGKGLLAPGWFLVFTLLCEITVLIASILEPEFSMGIYGWLLSAFAALMICCVSATESCLTENGQAGVWEIDRFLQNPEEYYC